MKMVPDEQWDNLVARVAALETFLATPPSVTREYPAMFDYDPVTRTVRLAAYENLDAETKALLAQQRAAEERDGVIVPVLGERFMLEAAIQAFGLTYNDAFVIRRSCAQAGTDFNVGRWCFADATSDEKLRHCTAIRADEDPAAVIESLVGYIRRKLGAEGDRARISGDED